MIRFVNGPGTGNGSFLFLFSNTIIGIRDVGHVVVPFRTIPDRAAAAVYRIKRHVRGPRDGRPGAKREHVRERRAVGNVEAAPLATAAADSLGQKRCKKPGEGRRAHPRQQQQTFGGRASSS